MHVSHASTSVWMCVIQETLHLCLSSLPHCMVVCHASNSALVCVIPASLNMCVIKNPWNVCISHNSQSEYVSSHTTECVSFQQLFMCVIPAPKIYVSS